MSPKVHQIRNSMRFVAYQDRKRVAASSSPSTAL